VRAYAARGPRQLELPRPFTLSPGRPAQIADADIFIKDAAWLIGDLEPWGWLMLMIGLVQLAAVPSIVRGIAWGHWVGIASVLGNMAAQVAFLSDVAILAVLLLLLDAMVLHALLVTRGGLPQAMRW
jgi:hypothetical protein